MTKLAITLVKDIEDFFHAFNNRQWGELSKYLSDDCVWDASEKRIEGLDNMIDYWKNYHVAFNETLGKPENVVFGDKTVYLQVKIHLDFLKNGKFYGRSYKKGDSIEFACSDFYELNDEGKIKSGCVYIKIEKR
jgi:hypothetical protein